MSVAKIALGLNKGEFAKKFSAIVDNHAVNSKLIGKPRDLVLTACRMTERWAKMANDPTVEVRVKNWKAGPRKVKMLVLVRPVDKREQPVTKGQLVDQLYPPRKTVNHASPEKKHALAVRSAMRTAVDYQLKSYRKTLRYPVECFHTQRQIRRGMRLDVDHILKPFVQLCDEFVASFDLKYSDIPLSGPPNLKRFKDAELHKAWQLYHECHARLAPSCPKANRAAGSGEYQASEALIGSFAKTDPDDFDIDF
jgi:hypothetical protein